MSAPSSIARASVATGPRRRWLGLTALGLGILTTLTALVTWLWASATPDASALGIAVIGMLVVVVLAPGALIFGVVALVASSPRAPALIGLALACATVVVLVLAIIPR